MDQSALAEAGVELIVLFGSRARGTEHDRSDTDIALLLKPGLDARLKELDAIRVALGGGDDIDLANLNRADPLLLYGVAIDGQPLYQAHKGAWEVFRLRAIKRYWDSARFRELEPTWLRKRHA